MNYITKMQQNDVVTGISSDLKCKTHLLQLCANVSCFPSFVDAWRRLCQQTTSSLHIQQ